MSRTEMPPPVNRWCPKHGYQGTTALATEFPPRNAPSEPLVQRFYCLRCFADWCDANLEALIERPQTEA